MSADRIDVHIRRLVVGAADARNAALWSSALEAAIGAAIRRRASANADAGTPRPHDARRSGGSSVRDVIAADIARAIVAKHPEITR
jgi:hypothetical protein